MDGLVVVDGLILQSKGGKSEITIAPGCFLVTVEGIFVKHGFFD